MPKYNSLYKNAQTFLNCSWLLYIIFFLAASDLYIFAVNGELFFVALFVIIGFLTTFFSKNMTVILMVAMTLTNILRFGKDVRIQEGMEDSSSGVNAVGSTLSGSDTIQIPKDDEGGDYQFLDNPDNSNVKKSKKESFKESLIEAIMSEDKELSPAAAPAASPISSSLTPKDISNKIAGLDQDTLALLQKQQKLLENMENLKPLLNNAERLLENFNQAPQK